MRGKTYNLRDADGNIKDLVKTISILRDGGTAMLWGIVKEEYYIDNRIGHQETWGKLFDKSPHEPDAKILPYTLEEIIPNEAQIYALEELVNNIAKKKLNE